MSQGFTSQLPVPLPVAQGGTGVTTSTGTGNTVLSTSPTLTAPRINQINDSNGNANLAIYAATSAVNYMTSFNSSTGGYTGFEVTGADTNANAYIKPKGDAGFAVITSAVAAAPFAIFSGTAQQHVTTFSFANTAAGRAVTFPDATGNVVLSSSTTAQTGNIAAWVFFNGTGSPITVTASGNVTSITDNNVGDYTVNFTNNLANSNYCAMPIPMAVSGSTVNCTRGAPTRAVGSYRFQVGGTAANADAADMCFAAIL